MPINTDFQQFEEELCNFGHFYFKTNQQSMKQFTSHKIEKRPTLWQSHLSHNAQAHPRVLGKLSQVYINLLFQINIYTMISLLPLIALAALAAANPCPYCKWDACSFTIGSLPNCTACYDVAALVPVKIPHTSINPPLGPLGVCQLCPDHCSACAYVLAQTFYLPIPIIRCTTCAVGYLTNEYTGKCETCPSNCGSCQFIVLTPGNTRPYPVMNCTSCNSGTTNDYMSGTCKPCFEHCLECLCSGKGCLMTCTQCQTGYILNQGLYGEITCIASGSRLLARQNDSPQ